MDVRRKHPRGLAYSFMCASPAKKQCKTEPNEKENQDSPDNTERKGLSYRDIAEDVNSTTIVSDTAKAPCSENREKENAAVGQSMKKSTNNDIPCPSSVAPPPKLGAWTFLQGSPDASACDNDYSRLDSPLNKTLECGSSMLLPSPIQGSDSGSPVRVPRTELSLCLSALKGDGPGTAHGAMMVAMSNELNQQLVPVNTTMESATDRLSCVVRHLEQRFGSHRGLRGDAVALGSLPCAVDCMYELLMERPAQLESINGLAQQSTRLQREVDSLQQERKGLGFQLASERSALAAVESRCAAMEESFGKERLRWGDERKELITRAMKLQHKDSKYTAEVHKKEADLNKIKDTLYPKLYAKGSNYGGMDMASRLGPTTALPVPKVLEDVAVRAQAARAAELEKENERLRQTLHSLAGEFRSLKEYQSQHADLMLAKVLAAQAAAAIEADSQGDRIQGMPAEWLIRHLGDTMGKAAVAMQAQLIEVLQEAQVVSANTSCTECEALSTNLKTYRSLLRQQHDVLVKVVMQTQGPPVDKSELDMSAEWEKEHEIRTQTEKEDQMMDLSDGNISLPLASPATKALLTAAGLTNDD